MAEKGWKVVLPMFMGTHDNFYKVGFLYEHFSYEKSRQNRRKKGWGWQKTIITEIVATNVVASQLPKHQPTATLTTHAKSPKPDMLPKL